VLIRTQIQIAHPTLPTLVNEVSLPMMVGVGTLTLEVPGLAPLDLRREGISVSYRATDTSLRSAEVVQIVGMKFDDTTQPEPTLRALAIAYGFREKNPKDPSQQ
jgi:hypothetical protein